MPAVSSTVFVRCKTEASQMMQGAKLMERCQQEDDDACCTKQRKLTSITTGILGMQRAPRLINEQC